MSSERQPTSRPNFHDDYATDLFLELCEVGYYRCLDDTRDDGEGFRPVSRIEVLRQEFERTGNMESVIEAYCLESECGHAAPAWCTKPISLALHQWYTEGWSLDSCFNVQPKQGRGRSGYHHKEAARRRDRSLCFEIFFLRAVVPGLTLRDAARLVASTYSSSTRNGRDVGIPGEQTLAQSYKAVWGRFIVFHRHAKPDNPEARPPWKQIDPAEYNDDPSRYDSLFKKS